MKNISDILKEGILDMTDDEVLDKKTQVRDLAIIISMKDHAPAGPDRDACGNKLQKGDFVLFPEAKGMKGILPLGVGEIINISKMLSIQTKLGRVSKFGYQCVKVTKDSFQTT